jgi:hypothetical protein
MLCYSDMSLRIRRASRSLLSDLDDDSFAIHLTAGQMLDGLLGISRVLELHEACSLRFTLSIEEQSGPLHGQILATKEAIEGTLSGLVVQVAHVDRRLRAALTRAGSLRSVEGLAPTEPTVALGGLLLVEALALATASVAVEAASTRALVSTTTTRRIAGSGVVGVRLRGGELACRFLTRLGRGSKATATVATATVTTTSRARVGKLRRSAGATATTHAAGVVVSFVSPLFSGGGVEVLRLVVAPA